MNDCASRSALHGHSSLLKLAKLRTEIGLYAAPVWPQETQKPFTLKKAT